MTDFSPEALSAIGPKEFTQLVKSTPDSKIAEVMGSVLADNVDPAQALADAEGKFASLVKGDPLLK